MAVKLVQSIPDHAPLRYVIFETAWGSMAFAACSGLVTDVFLPCLSMRSLSHTITTRCRIARRDDNLQPRLQHQFVDYFAGRNVTFDYSVDVSWASVFARSVLRQCCRIEPGRTINYGRLAQLADRPRAARAVGTVMAQNRTPILIPCHRVIKADGSPGRFSAAGTNYKNRLLRHESTLCSH